MESADLRGRGGSREVEISQVGGIVHWPEAIACVVSTRDDVATRDAFSANIISIDSMPIVDVDEGNSLDYESSASLHSARFICTTVIKRHENDYLGIALKCDDNGHLRISSILPKGLLRVSSLRSGDMLLKVNDIDCSSLDASTITLALRQLTGPVTLLAMNDNGDPTLNETLVEKDIPGQHTGLKFYKDSPSSLKITGIDANGIFAAQPLLRPGDKILAINAIPCSRLDAKLAADMIRFSLGYVKLLFETNGSACRCPIDEANRGKVSGLHLPGCNFCTDQGEITDRAAYVSATFFKPSRDVKVGIALMEDDNGILRIMSINPKGGLSASPLRPNDRLLSINNIDCTSMSQTNATRFLRSMTGTISIVAQHEGGRVNMVQSMVEKRTPDTFVGISVNRINSGSLIISKIKEDGLFAQSLLNVGDRLLSVNGQSCLNQEIHVVIGMIKSASQYVSIAAQTNSATAVVIAADSTRKPRKRDPIQPRS